MKHGYTMKKMKIKQQQTHPGDLEAPAMLTPWLRCKMDFIHTVQVPITDRTRQVLSVPALRKSY